MNRRQFLRMTGVTCVGSSLPVGYLAASVEDKTQIGEEAGMTESNGREPLPQLMENREHVCYCGLYCKLCRFTHKPADILKRDLEHRHGDGFARDAPEFWETLSSLAEEPKGTCRNGGCNGGFPCAIRQCAKKRGVFTCPECEQYPCHRIEILAGGSAFNLVFDGQRMRKIGLDAWIQEQEERIRDGFHYHMLQCEPCVVPRIGSEHDRD